MSLKEKYNRQIFQFTESIRVEYLMRDNNETQNEESHIVLTIQWAALCALNDMCNKKSVQSKNNIFLEKYVAFL